MLSKVALYAVLLSKLALASLAVVHEELATVPFGWKEVGKPDANTQITLSIALAQQNLDQLESKLMSVSTPGSEQYVV